MIDIEKNFPNNALVIATSQIRIENDITLESKLDSFLETLIK